MVGIALLSTPCRMLAQRGGGAHVSKPVICVYDCPNTEGRSSLNDLKEFQRVMAMQATPEQRAAFAKIAQYTQAASDRLQAFRESFQKTPASSPLSERATDLSQDIAKARAGNQNFLTSFSSVQKSGLKEITSKLEKADSELDKQLRALDQIVQSPKPESEQLVSATNTVDKALTSFQNEQLALGGEMSIIFPSAGQNLAFSLPQLTNSIDIAGQPVAIPTSGAISRMSPATSSGTSAGSSVEDGHNLFSFRLVADLSDLQQNITGLLRSELNRSPRCGDRIEVQDATLIPTIPAGLVIAHLHFEHWICTPGQSPIEVADSDATLEVKLTLSVVPTTGLALTAEITRVQAEGLLRDSLRSGDLGFNLRDQIAASLLSALKKGADLKTTLPPVAKDLATIQKAQFDDAGADQLSLLLDGQLQLTDEQTKQFATQLNQRLSAQKTPTPTP